MGVTEIKEISYSVMFDRIEAGTYLIAAAVTEGNLKIKKVIPKIMRTEINVLRKLVQKYLLKKMKFKLLEEKN